MSKCPGAFRHRIKDGIGWIICDNPARANAISREMSRAIPGLIEQMESDPAVRVVVVRGAGDRVFMSGADITDLERGHRADPVDRWIKDDLTGAWSALGKPLIAMINGHCIGAGMAVALQADLRIAADDVKFGIPAARLGVGYPLQAMKMVVDRIGAAAASDLLMTARNIPAPEAYTMGLVSRVVPRTELEQATHDLANGIARNAPLTLRTMKRALREISRDPAQTENANLNEMVLDCFRSNDFAEGMKAFAEKRPPRFSGN